MILAGMASEHQDLPALLQLLFAALSTYGCASNSRSILKILYNLCRKTLSVPFRAPCLAFDATYTARLAARREPPQLWVSIEAECRHGYGTKGPLGLELRGSLTGIDRQGGS